MVFTPRVSTEFSRKSLSREGWRLCRPFVLAQKNARVGVKIKINAREIARETARDRELARDKDDKVYSWKKNRNESDI